MCNSIHENEHGINIVDNSVKSGNCISLYELSTIYDCSSKTEYDINLNVGNTCNSTIPVNSNALYDNLTINDSTSIYEDDYAINIVDHSAHAVANNSLSNLSSNVTDNSVHARSSNSSMRSRNMLNLHLDTKGMKIGHINIQGMQNKIDQVRVMLNYSRNDVHVLGISESKLSSVHPDNYFHINNFQSLYRKDRIISTERKEEGGGIIVYVKDGVRCKRREDLESDRLECLWIELFPKNSKSFLVGNMYRHPNESVNWNNEFENQIEKVLQQQKEFYLLGDFNRDLLNKQTSKGWLDFIEPFGLTQVVSTPTRITNHSKTLIDHIYCSIKSNVSAVSVPKLGLSDHFPVFLIRKSNSIIPKNSHYCISYRSFKNFNENDFTSALKTVPWDIVKMFDETNDIIDTWSKLFLDIVNTHLPMKQHRVKRKQQPKWLTPDIIDAMKMRDKFKSLNNDTQYKLYRNKVIGLIKKSKKAQYTAIINENNNKPSSVWKLFKEVGASKRNTSSTIFALNVDGKTIESPEEIANEFNKFFVTIASKVKEPIKKSNFKKLNAFCNDRIPQDICFNIPEITNTQVEKYLKAIDVSKATGLDDIGPRLLKISAPYIADSITHICNVSIKSGIFPEKWKEGKVTPLFKAGDKSDPNNYRPISILPVLSKLLEKHVHDSLMEYLVTFNLLHTTQSGFRPKHSCETALACMIDNWLSAINNGQVIGAVMVDFKKAFDLVDHSLLLKKLCSYKLSNIAINWFSSYLLNRSQKVSTNNTISEAEHITSGVPQGSILGPLMFLLFINDLPLYTDIVNTDLYADDTTLYDMNKSIPSVKENLENALEKLSKWCKENGMVINSAKTKVMLVTTHQNQIRLNVQCLGLKLNDKVLKTVSNDKILGVHIENTLTWSIHTDKIAKKIATNLWLLNTIKDFLSLDHRIQFYKTYIQPHIDYCSIIWGATSQSNLNRLYNLQKRACKIILDYEYSDIVKNMEELKILNVYERIFLRKAKFMFNVNRNKTPRYINNLFRQRQHNANLPLLRSVTSTNYIPPRPYKEIFKQCISYSGSIIWNCLPNYLKKIKTMTNFHCQCIQWMKAK
ncbi:MAG: reverse transcriptase family protein [Sedimenticola sp.]